MKTSPFEAVRHHRLVPVVAIRDADAAPDLAAALVAGGLPILEVTLRTEAAAAALASVAAVKGELTLAAGTVTSAEQVKLAVDCGAELIVSPGLNTNVIEYCLKHDIPVLPGICTPTEIETARNYGLRTLKFFPAEAYGGVRTLRALSDVYGGFAFVPTGGINLQSVGDYLKLPTVIACGGSWMAPTDLINERRWDAITKLAEESVAVVRAKRVFG
jgi:2-dehydro-3-deoxyphosphogluconate aldolase / (4S)-4-hydroxy-2-oxoglutarate aldolase